MREALLPPLFKSFSPQFSKRFWNHYIEKKLQLLITYKMYRMSSKRQSVSPTFRNGRKVQLSCHGAIGRGCRKRNDVEMNRNLEAAIRRIGI